MPAMKRYHYIPIYNVNLTLHVTDNATRTYNQIAFHYKMDRVLGDSDAICQSDGKGNFFLVFKRESVSENTIAHEVNHCTDRIMEFIDHNHCSHCSNEPRAYLCGYIQGWVKSQLKAARVRMNK